MIAYVIIPPGWEYNDENYSRSGHGLPVIGFNDEAAARKWADDNPFPNPNSHENPEWSKNPDGTLPDWWAEHIAPVVGSVMGVDIR